MKDNELFELCKQVYEATRLESGTWYVEKYGDITTCDENSYEWSEFPGYMDHKLHPLYTSDYLLEKLRNKAFVIRVFAMSDEFVEKRLEENIYCAAYRQMWKDFESRQYYADTPLKALLKLTLALHKENLL